MRVWILFNLSSLLLLLLPSIVDAQPPPPILAIPDSAVLSEDFSKSMPLPKTIWQKRQGTRWEVTQGVLRGIPSSPEYQAAKKDHFGYEARLSIPATPAEFVANFRIRFLDGKETSIVPFIEFGHHVCRVRFGQDGASLLADHEMWRLDHAPDFVWKSGMWYQITAEMKGGQFVMQIENGPTLQATHSSFATPPTSGGNGLGVAGPRNGTVEVDDLMIFTVKNETQPGWKTRQSQFPKRTPIQIKQPKAKRKKAGSTKP